MTRGTVRTIAYAAAHSLSLDGTAWVARVTNGTIQRAELSYWRAVRRTLGRFPEFRSRAEWWTWHLAGIAVPSMTVPLSAYWISPSLAQVLVLVGGYGVLASLTGGWWLHAGRTRFPLSAEAVERIEAREIRKQARDERRAEQWRGTV